MNWKDYFEKASGTGHLATSDKEGRVDIAVYSPPWVQEDGTIVFGMADRLTHANLKENRFAAYAFSQGEYKGVRLYLEKVKEETEGPVLEAIKGHADRVSVPGAGAAIQFAVHFRIVKDLPLVGT